MLYDSEMGSDKDNITVDDLKQMLKEAQNKKEKQAYEDGRRFRREPRRRVRWCSDEQAYCSCEKKRNFSTDGDCMSCKHRRCAECMTL